MSDAPTPDPAPADPAASSLETVRGLVTTATQHLLGGTISITDEEWNAPSGLPGWTRGHVATHLARNADALARLTEWARTGVRQNMYASKEQRNTDIESGAGRSGLDIQIDLDTSAGRLGDAFDQLDDAHTADKTSWDNEVELRAGTVIKARVVPLARLNEVVLHHVDLQVGYGIDDVETSTAEWLLEWCASRLKDGLPNIRLVSDSGFTLNLGDASATEVSGTSQRLLGWLSGRTDPAQLTGTEGLTVPGL